VALVQQTNSEKLQEQTERIMREQAQQVEAAFSDLNAPMWKRGVIFVKELIKAKRSRH
jgi:hypothetical protein